MKIKNKDSIGYKGTVEIGLVRNGKKFKRRTSNAGRAKLFRYLGECLIARLNPNYSASVENRPGNLRILNNNTSILSYNIGFSDITLNVHDEGDNSYCEVVFNFLIPGSLIYNKRIQKVQLMSINQSDNEPYAEASFIDPIVVTDIDTNVYVSWVLTISNK